MNKLKHKNHLKAISLKSLIVVPACINKSIVSVPVEIYTDNDKVNIKEDAKKLRSKSIEAIEANLRRLEKVRNRIIETSREGKTELLDKVDNMIKFFKQERTKAESIKNINNLNEISKEITKMTNKNDINLGQVFDGRKDGKREKFYNKLRKKFEDAEVALNKFSDNRKGDLLKVLHKGYNLINQLSYEETKNKGRAETKKIRRELASVFNELKFLL